jgi:hypothetical protein
LHNRRKRKKKFFFWIHVVIYFEINVHVRIIYRK